MGDGNGAGVARASGKEDKDGQVQHLGKVWVEEQAMRVGVDHKQVEDVKVEETGEALQHEVDTKVVPAARLVAIDNSRVMSGPGKKRLCRMRKSDLNTL